MKRLLCACCVLWFLLGWGGQVEAAERLKLLFLGDNGHHQPPLRFRQLQPVLAERGIDLTYTDQVDNLNQRTLAQYAGLVIYANIDRISAEQEQALLTYVESGRGLIPLHCASFCFLNSEKYIALVGAQFQRHGTGVFRTELALPDHPLLKGFGGFESWDETYVHHKHNEQDRTVLEFRAEGDQREPWTWVRTQGRGRVFYTAWGHDARTWSNPGFHNLVERGIRWAVGGDPAVAGPYRDRPEMTSLAKDAQPFEYVEAEVPFYPPGKQWGKIEEGKRAMQLPVSPAESIKHLSTPVELEPRLFVSEPQLQGKPLCIAWDERGRLLVGESIDYPNELQPPGKGRDRLRICEDTDGDGVADRSTVFADNLSIPSTISFCHGGVLCQAGTETIFLKDTDGDDRADLRQVLITGWGMGDTHGGVSNFQYGLDNWHWGMQGYNRSEPVINGQKQPGFAQGFFRFQVVAEGKGVKVAAIEFIRSTNNNTWGLGFSEEGLVFGSTANGNPSVFMPIPNRHYEAVRGWSSSVLSSIADSNRFEPITDRVRQVDHHGGFTAAAGHALYTARNYPREYWNRTAFVTEPTGHLVATFALSREGSEYRARNAWNLLASDDEWTAPIMAEVGPDGNVWVVDWYNYIVQHNPTPAGFQTGKGNAYESELRDKKHGRIYRLTAKAGQGKAAPKLHQASTVELVQALSHDNFLWRRAAQRMLIERRADEAVPALLKLIDNQHVDEIGLNVGAIHALWTLHGLGKLTGEHADAAQAAIGALAHPAAGVRRNAVSVLPRDAASLAALLKSQILQDADAQVRLAALLAVAEMPAGPAAANAVLAELSRGENQDRWLTDGCIAAAAQNDRHFLQAVSLASTAKATGPALTQPRVLQAVTTVSEHYARGGSAVGLAEILSSLGKAAPATIEAIVTGLTRGWPKDQPIDLTPAMEAALVQLVEQAPVAVRGSLVNLAARWGSKSLEAHVAEIARGLLETAQHQQAEEKDRLAAARQLVEFRPEDPAVVADLLALISPKTSVELATGLVEAAGKSAAAAGGQQLIGSLNSLTPGVRPVAVRAILSRGDWTADLVTAFEKGEVSLGELSLEQKQALAAHPDKGIATKAKALLARGGDLPDPDRQKVIDQFLPVTQRTGDVELGKAVFKKTCIKCHTHSGEGARIGPDLTGMAVHPKHELLIHILDPSRSVEGNFRIYTVATDEGRVLSGLLASESKTAIELIDVEAKRHTVLRENIEQLEASRKSLMPEGFEKQHTADDLCNLLEFLTQRGKFLPIPLDKFATVVTTKGMFYSPDADVERFVLDDWKPRLFEGTPFVLIDPQGDRQANAIMLQGPIGYLPPKMPKSVSLPCNTPAKSIHLLSGMSGWGFPASAKGSVTMTVRLHYADGQTEDHDLLNGEHFADYIRRVDVPQSKFAFLARGQQVRYLAIHPQRDAKIERIELAKGKDDSAPIILAVTIETK